MNKQSFLILWCAKHKQTSDLDFLFLARCWKKGFMLWFHLSNARNDFPMLEDFC